ncbi:MAG: hypothetical protein BZY88_18405 [SAR202 cluster bacterium Io17-Chloro-G9]|nr:MAG: hypothetical protein BZY88_18405 [SAR202 cluster bacterium Io17-Chloro-G9]
MDTLVKLIEYVFNALFVIILARVILSFIVPMMGGGRSNPLLANITALVYQITEPILGPMRRYTTFGMFDLSPMIALILLQVIRSVVVSSLR